MATASGTGSPACFPVEDRHSWFCQVTGTRHDDKCPARHWRAGRSVYGCRVAGDRHRPCSGPGGYHMSTDCRLRTSPRRPGRHWFLWLTYCKSTRYGREQSGKTVVSAIRRRFVPALVRTPGGGLPVRNLGSEVHRGTAPGHGPAATPVPACRLVRIGGLTGCQWLTRQPEHGREPMVNKFLNTPYLAVNKAGKRNRG